MESASNYRNKDTKRARFSQVPIVTAVLSTAVTLGLDRKEAKATAPK